MHLNRLLVTTPRGDGVKLRAGLIRLTGGDIDAAEDALQEACARALETVTIGAKRCYLESRLESCARQSAEP